MHKAQASLKMNDPTALTQPYLLDDASSDSGKRLPGGYLFSRLPYIPLVFLGLGLYRAWIELVFVGSFVAFPYNGEAGHDLYDIAMILTLFTCAIFHRQVAPLFRRRSIYLAALASMIVGTVCAFGTLALSDVSEELSWGATILGGVGTALVILIWSELYSCLSPYRVGLYYCASIVAAAFIIYFCRGLSGVWLAGTAVLLPVASIAFAMLGFLSLDPDEQPRAQTARFSFPWKPTLLMAVYAFAFGLRETSQYATTFGPHSAFGTVVMGLVLLVLISKQSGNFQFTTLYRSALPLMMGAFLVLPSFGWFNGWIADFCATASYTAFSVMIMLIMAHMSYRYGMSAVWLFGIERGVRAMFSLAGRQTSEAFSLLGSNVASLAVGSITIALVVIGTLLIVSEKDFLSRWGVSFKGDSSAPGELDLLYRQDISKRCADAASRFGLTSREGEVLALLATGLTIGQIQRRLVISKDTAKTHIRHIYQKMDVHSREGLFDILGISGPASNERH